MIYNLGVMNSLFLGVIIPAFNIKGGILTRFPQRNLESAAFDLLESFNIHT